MESLIIACKGIYSNNNELSSAPVGAMKLANNIVIQKDSIAECRRGLARLEFRLPLTSDRADKLLQYQNTLLVHYRNTQLARYDSVNGIVPYSGSYINPDNNLARIKSAEANQNFYFTSARGIQKMDVVTTTPYQAGMFKGLDLLATPSVNPSGFMANQTQVAYRLLWGTTDANGNLVLGSPSQRAIVANQSGSPQNVNVSATVPVGVTVNDFYQLYRGNQASSLFTSAFATIEDISYQATPAFEGTAGNNINIIYTGGGVGDTAVLTVNYSTLTLGSLVYTSNLAGGLGNQISIAYANTAVAGSETVTVIGNAITVGIQSGVSTQNQVKAAINASTPALALISISGSSASAVTTTAPTFLTGGSISVQIDSGVTTAQTIFNALVGNSVVTSIVTPVITGAGTNTQTTTTTTLSGGTVTLVTPDDNMQLVFEGTTSGSTLTLQGNTYTSVLSGTISTNIKVAYVGGGTAGSEVVAVLPSNAVVQDLTYTSVALAGLGDLVSVQYTSPAGVVAGSEIVTVSGNKIVVQIQSGVSTAAQIFAAINASVPALNIVSVAISGAGGNTQVTGGPTSLSGGEVKVQVQSGVSTAQNVFNAVTASAAASAIVSLVLVSSGTLQSPAGPSSLTGGVSTINILDLVPDSLRGAALYTNQTQEGILQANELPPFAADVATFRNCLFFGNTRTKQVLPFSILAVAGTNGVQLNSTITIAGTTYTAGSSEIVGSNQFQLVTTGSAAQNVNDTALSLCRVINQSSTNTSVYAYYVSSGSGLPGMIQIEERFLGGSFYSITTGGPQPANGTGTAYSPTLPASGIKVSSTNQTNLNGLMYSKQQQPDAVPSLNIFYVGSAAKKILRIIALRDSLMILKEDGIFRCTGAGPSSFNIDSLDPTAVLLAPESAAPLANQIYALTSQGVVSISDTGVEVLSRNIEDQLLPLFSEALTATSYFSFGVGYETDRQYILWTISEVGDTFSNQAFVYNIFTRAWTRWTRDQSSGLILLADNKLYVTDPTTSYINQERKNGLNTDFADEAISVTISAINQYVITLNEVIDATVGDLLFQSGSVYATITAVDPINLTVTVSNLLTWNMSAPTFIEKAIACQVEWVPNAANGQPGYLKQWSEAAILLKQNSFNTASLAFYSDVSGSIDVDPFPGNTGGVWGFFPWGMIPWGGVFKSLPVRTYVPLEKQRCDLLSVQFLCQEAWSQFQVEGIALSFRYISTRTGR